MTPWCRSAQRSRTVPVVNLPAGITVSRRTQAHRLPSSLTGRSLCSLQHGGEAVRVPALRAQPGLRPCPQAPPSPSLTSGLAGRGSYLWERHRAALSWGGQG